MSTPMRRQYEEAKQRHPGMLLLFRMGDFFELFDDDADLVSRLLDLKKSRRDGYEMAGFPHHQIDQYLRRLLQAGHRVAVCDQVESAAEAKGIVRREVTRIVTPGTVTEDDLLDPSRPHHLIALYPHREGYGLAWVDPSTGSFHAATLPGGRFADEIARLHAAECLIRESDHANLREEVRAILPAALTERPDWTFDPETARAALKNQFGVTTFGGFGFDDQDGCLIAAGSLVIYLQETLRANLGHLRRLRPYAVEEVLLLDEVTRRSLELTRTLRDGSREGSLLAVLDRTVTAMGARLLHDALTLPLRDRGEIERRLDAVEELLHEHGLRGELRQSLKEAYDLQRLTGRVSTGRATARDLIAIARTLRLLPRFKAKLTGRRAALLGDLESRVELCPDLRELLDSGLTDDPPSNPKDGGVIREGYSPELDELRQLAREGKSWIAQYQAEQITKTAIPSLKVGFTNTVGYFIEVTNTHQSKVPEEYKLERTYKSYARYSTAELREYAEKVLSAEERAITLEEELFTGLRERVAEETPRLLSTAEVLAWIDMLASLAELAASRGYSRPQMCDDPILEIDEGRHPVLDQLLPPGTLVPNGVTFGPEQGYLWLITGPNMSGKSIFIKQTALICLMAHMGSFVPAKSARVGLTDRIFTRVGASDELSRGQSTFMVEMTEAANILNNATDRSLIILDEIGRGTSTYDGISLAWAITEYLHDQVRARALFATHYHELAQLADSLSGLRNYNVLVRETEDGIVFLHKIAAGSADRSYGIHVAKLAGVPDAVLTRAEGVLAELESAHHMEARPEVIEPSERPKPRRRPPRTQTPSLFGDDEEI